MSPVPFALAAKALIQAARRALERGDHDEFDRLFETADEQVAHAISAIPVEVPRA